MIMRIDVRHNFDQVARAVGLFGQQLADQAAARTLNRAVEKGRTAMSREIRSEYRLSAQQLRDRLRISRARPGATVITAKLTGTGKRSMNLIAFVEQVETLKQRAARVKKGTAGQLFVKVKKRGGKKSLGAYAFIGNKGRTVFTRQARTGAISKRLPIYPVQTIDVPQMFNQRRINKVVRDFVVVEFQKNFPREAAFYARRAGLITR